MLIKFCPFCNKELNNNIVSFCGNHVVSIHISNSNSNHKPTLLYCIENYTYIINYSKPRTLVSYNLTDQFKRLVFESNSIILIPPEDLIKKIPSLSKLMTLV